MKDTIKTVSLFIITAAAVIILSLLVSNLTASKPEEKQPATTEIGYDGGWLEGETYDEYVARARQHHPRAYEKWHEDEEERLRSLTAEGRTKKEIAAILQRTTGAVASRQRKLGL